MNNKSLNRLRELILTLSDSSDLVSRKLTCGRVLEILDSSVPEAEGIDTYSKSNDLPNTPPAIRLVDSYSESSVRITNIKVDQSIVVYIESDEQKMVNLISELVIALREVLARSFSNKANRDYYESLLVRTNDVLRSKSMT